MRTTQHDTLITRIIIDRQAIELLDAVPTIDMSTLSVKSILITGSTMMRTPLGTRRHHRNRCSECCSYESC